MAEDFREGGVDEVVKRAGGMARRVRELADQIQVQHGVLDAAIREGLEGVPYQVVHVEEPLASGQERLAAMIRASAWNREQLEGMERVLRQDLARHYPE